MNSKLILFVCAIILLLSDESTCEYLRIEENKFFYGDQQVFLSGANIAWHNYGNDFGNENYASSRGILEEYIRGIKAAGGNTLRIWIHVEGADTPQFDPNGYVTAPDAAGNFINDLSTFLDYAEENDVFVIPVLWNGAVMRDERYIGMLLDDSKLESYINNGLKPVVRGLRNKPALAAWEIVNEPEGSVAIESNDNPCFDTIKIGQGGAGWTGVGIPMKRFLSFINRQNAAIRAEDPKALITAGSWSERSQNSAFADSFNHYSDECLTTAGDSTGEEWSEKHLRFVSDSVWPNCTIRYQSHHNDHNGVIFHIKSGVISKKVKVKINTEGNANCQWITKVTGPDFRVNVKNNSPRITKTQFEDMNDYCLLEIFSSNSLNLLDLCSIAETCSRFQQIIEGIFPKKFALEKNGHYIVDSGRYYGEQLEEHDVKRVMARLGCVVSDFSISERISRCLRERVTLDCVFMDAVTRSCFDNLKRLQIYGFKMPADYTDKFKVIFKRLQLLELQWVSTSDATIFKGLDSLVELRVMQVETCSTILQQLFPRLERFTYFTPDIRMGQSFDTLMTFISRHNSLKALDLCFYSDTECIRTLLEAIGNDCKKLMELWLRVGLSTFKRAHLTPLQAFKSLRTLGLSEVPCGSFQFVSGLTQLRELHLCGCTPPVDLNHFDALAQLTKLAISDCRTSDGFDVVGMIGRLKSLEELKIYWLCIQNTKFKLSKNEFDQIVVIVRDRPQILMLKCEFYFDFKDSEMGAKIVLCYYIGD